MQLFIDLGNSGIRIARPAADGIELLLGASHVERPLAAALVDACEHAELPETVDAVYAASVAALPRRAELDAWLFGQGLPPAHYLQSTGAACGVSNSYAEPRRLGVDRWLAVIAAHHRAPGAACIVDAGTALTVDVVAADGQHLGGLIAPGVASQRRSMQAGTGQVRPRGFPDDLQLLGQNSEQALAFGSIHAVLGLIERVSAGLARSHDIQHWYLTGGEAPLLTPHLPDYWQSAPLLVLEGLAHVAAEQAKA